MKPRLKTSKKWTNFPNEYSDQIKTVFSENFSAQLQGAKLQIEGRIYPHEITLRVGILQEGRLAGANFEVSSNYVAEGTDAVDKIHLCVDAAAAMMTEYFENPDEVDFPYLWKEVTFGTTKIFVQFSTENPDLEAEANKLLGMENESMLQEDDENDVDAMAHAEIDEEISPARDENLEDAEDSESFADEENESEDEEAFDNQPRMFGGSKKIKKEDMH